MNTWSNDTELFELMRKELFSCVIGDVMDKLGLHHQILPPYLRPLQNEMIVAGRAMPVLEADFFAESSTGNNPLANQPFGLMFRALDDLAENEVYVATGASHRYALWGELMSMRARKLGASGAVVDGHSRDTHGIIRMNFPTFSKGPYCQDQGVRGKVLDWRISIEVGGVRVNPGDIIFGDIDGVLIIPKAAERDIICRALEKVRGERTVAKHIGQGMSTVEAYARFGIM